jgi:opine dehydrogenase
MRDIYLEIYGVEGDTLSDMIHKVEAYSCIKGQKEMETRYLTEEVPYALMPIISLGNKAGIDTTLMKAIVTMAELVLGRDMTSNARTLESLGLKDMDISEIVIMVNIIGSMIEILI